jgi:hypothetical protein
MGRHDLIEASGTHQHPRAMEIGLRFGFQRHHWAQQDRAGQDTRTQQQRTCGDVGAVGIAHRDQILPVDAVLLRRALDPVSQFVRPESEIFQIKDTLG